MSPDSTRFAIHCPRCGIALAFDAADGETVACEGCGQRLEIVEGQALWDPTASARRRHLVECPRCGNSLSFFANDDDVVQCEACGMPLEVLQAHVVYDPRLAARAGAGAAPAGPTRGTDLRAEARERIDERIPRIQPGDVRVTLPRAERVAAWLAAATDPELARAGRRLEILVRVLRDWWDEAASFGWDEAKVLAATLTCLEGADSAEGELAAGRLDAALVDECTQRLADVIAAHAAERDLDVP